MPDGDPYKPVRTCREPGCTRPVAPGQGCHRYCVAHKDPASRAPRGPYRRRIVRGARRADTEIRRDLAEQFAIFLNRFDLMVKRDKTLDPLR